MSKDPFKKMSDTAFKGALTLNTIPLMSRPATVADAQGALTIGVVGGVTNAAWGAMEYKKKRRRR